MEQFKRTNYWSMMISSIQMILQILKQITADRKKKHNGSYHSSRTQKWPSATPRSRGVSLIILREHSLFSYKPDIFHGCRVLVVTLWKGSLERVDCSWDKKAGNRWLWRFRFQNPICKGDQKGNASQFQHNIEEDRTTETHENSPRRFYVPLITTLNMPQWKTRLLILLRRGLSCTV